MKRFDQINVIPFIDIMLVLLAIVLTTASFISTGLLQINLPQSKAAKNSNQALKVVEIAVTQEGRWLLDGKFVTFATLRDTILGFQADQRIRLRMDQNAVFAQFVRVVDLLKQRNIRHISIITQKDA